MADESSASSPDLFELLDLIAHNRFDVRTHLTESSLGPAATGASALGWTRVVTDELGVTYELTLAGEEAWREARALWRLSGSRPARREPPKEALGVFEVMQTIATITDGRCYLAVRPEGDWYAVASEEPGPDGGSQKDALVGLLKHLITLWAERENLHGEYARLRKLLGTYSPDDAAPDVGEG